MFRVLEAGYNRRWTHRRNQRAWPPVGQAYGDRFNVVQTVLYSTASQKAFDIPTHQSHHSWRNQQRAKRLRDQARERRAQNRERAIDLLGGKCVNCQTIDNLEFDHINPMKKVYEINRILKGTWLKIEIELAKCQLLCRSCHAKKTAEEQSINEKG